VTDDFFTLDVGSLNVRTCSGYLHFYCPDHPLARQNGYVALQRHLMSVQLGRWLGADEKVLFLNGDRTDVRPENLVLVTAAELRARTLGEPAAPVALSCQLCGKSFEAPASDGHRKYCSAKCAARSSRRFEVTPEELEKLVWEMPATQVAALFGVSDKAVEKRCKKYGIRKPPRGYWAKVQADMITNTLPQG
jgi:hypothetical protein